MERTEHTGLRQRDRRRVGPIPATVVMLVAAACGEAVEERSATPSPAPADAPIQAPVQPGVATLLADSLHLLSGRRVGLITNQTGVGADGTSSIDLLHRAPEIDLVVLFSPEHGIRGAAAAGAAVSDDIDLGTGLPIRSLYGETREPTPSMLADLDALVFDIQDIGARYYTYVSTMALAMRAAAAAGIPFVVLDRPDPIGGVLVQGTVLDEAFSSFVGLYPVPMRHGMTAGELARLFNEEHMIGVELHVVPATGWERGRWFDLTGLPWIAPSPNMPTLESATHYPGTALFEGTVLSVGRGTERPFQQIGAPWLNGPALARRLNRYGLEGVRFEPVRFTPEAPGDGKFASETTSGVRFIVTDRERYDPTIAAVAALVEARSMAGDRWEWRSGHFDRLAGTDALRMAVEAGQTLDEITTGWQAELEAFRKLRRSYLLY